MLCVHFQLECVFLLFCEKKNGCYVLFTLKFSRSSCFFFLSHTHRHTQHIHYFIFYSLHLEFNACVYVIFTIPVRVYVRFYRVLICGTFISLCFTITSKLMCASLKIFMYVVAACHSFPFAIFFFHQLFQWHQWVLRIPMTTLVYLRNKM